MKAYNILNILLLLTSFIAHSQQCPPSGLKIQMPLCDTPGNLRVSPLSCTSATLHWRGNSEQQYIVTLAGKDAADNLLFEEKKRKIRLCRRQLLCHYYRAGGRKTKLECTGHLHGQWCTHLQPGNTGQRGGSAPLRACRTGANKRHANQLAESSAQPKHRANRGAV